MYLARMGRRGGAGNSTAKETRIPQTMAMQIVVRDVGRGRRMNHQRVTGCQVLDFFVEQKLFIPRDRSGRYETLPFNTAYRVVRKWLSEFGGYDRVLAQRKSCPLSTECYKETPLPPDTEPSLQGRGSERCTLMRVTSMNTIIGTKSRCLIRKMTKMLYTKRRSTKAVAIASVQPSKGQTRPRVVEAHQEPEDKAGLVPGPIWAFFCHRRRETTKGTITKSSAATITSLGSESNSLQTCTNPLL
jgi:hypothetical protein